MKESIEKPLTAREISEIVGVSPQHIYMQVKLGKIPHFKIGNAIRFPANIINTHIFKGTKNENEI